jgi:hypothetical protein
MSHFKIHFDIQIQMVDNIWYFLKRRYKEGDYPAYLKLEVSKLINNVSSTAPEYCFEVKEYTFVEVQHITQETTQNQKTHLMFINKLSL